MNDDDIRSLLRDARSFSAMPSDVAGRLDDVLAGLGAEAPAAEVLPLRRRLAPRILAAAAAVVLVAGIGVGVQQVLQGSGGNDALTSKSVAADRALPTPAPVVAGQPEASHDNAYDDVQEMSRRLANRDLLKAVHGFDGVDLDVVPLSGEVTDRAPLAASAAQGDFLLRTDGRVAPGCVTPVLAALPGSVSGLVLHQGSPALLVVGPDQGGDVHLVELWSCGSHELISQQTLDLS